MKYLPLVTLIFAAAFWACSGSGLTDYDPDLCRDLSVKIENRDSLTQSDYSKMIEQDGAILRYLVDRTREVCEQPDSLRFSAWRTLTADPAYLERFGYMFTLGSSLYRADANGLLDSRNAENYRALGSYNEQLAEYSDRY